MAQASKLSAAVRANREWERATAQADGWILEYLGKYAEGKEWEWDVRPDADGQPVYDLRMTTDGAAVADRFDRFEVANQRVLRARLFPLVDRLLEAASKEQWNRIRQGLRELAEETAVAN